MARTNQGVTYSLWLLPGGTYARDESNRRRVPPSSPGSAAHPPEPTGANVACCGTRHATLACVLSRLMLRPLWLCLMLDTPVHAVGVERGRAEIPGRAGSGRGCSCDRGRRAVGRCQRRVQRQSAATGPPRSASSSLDPACNNLRESQRMHAAISHRCAQEASAVANQQVSATPWHSGRAARCHVLGTR
jgi:hypothetical protein